MLSASNRYPGSIHVLIIDDDGFTRNIILQVLHNLGFTRATGADSAESAMNLLASHAFDLIVTDVHMQGMNGLEFVRLIRSGKTRAKRDTRIMVLTSFSNTETLGAALALDTNGFLVKPLVPAVVDKKIAQAMSERLHLRLPIVYEAVNTEFKSLPGAGKQPHIQGSRKALASNDSGSVNHLLPGQLRPGMILKNNVHLDDGTLLLPSGYTLSESSINRLNDLDVLLRTNDIAVQETPVES